jgi:CDP-paratose 2-epimerase
MRLLITGICGFAGSTLALELKRQAEKIELIGLDNLSRSGSEQNRHSFKKYGIRSLHGDVRQPSDLENLPAIDWVIDAAANPSVLAGVSGAVSSRQLMENNLVGTLNLLELCRRNKAGLILLSTSRVYSLAQLSQLPMDVKDRAFVPNLKKAHVNGLTRRGVSEEFSTEPPLSLYGSAKLASEIVSREYGLAFNLPVFINRCGVLAGAGQFGKADQGIFSFWLHSCKWKRPLKYIGFGGSGHQVRDCLHPRDLASLVLMQVRSPKKSGGVLNVSGGIANSMSLAQLSDWAAARFGHAKVEKAPAPRKYDVPWLVLDSSKAEQEWSWRPTTKLDAILHEIAQHAEQHPEWLELSADL